MPWVCGDRRRVVGSLVGEQCVAGPKTAPPVNIWDQGCSFEAWTGRLEVSEVHIGSHLISILIDERCWACCFAGAGACDAQLPAFV